MKQTSKYKLNQWDKEDRILREDFNGDNGKLEAALAAVNERVDGLDAAVALCGNCRVEYSTYQGKGTYGDKNKNTLTFAEAPLLVVIVDQACRALFIHRDTSEASVNGCDVYFSWNGNTVAWYTNDRPETQFNSAYAYQVFTFYAKA